jgi:hypothetical protein
LRALSLANKPTRPPQVGAGAHAGSHAGAGQPQLSLAAFAACSLASKPTRPPQDGAGAHSGAQAAGAPHPERA